VFVKTRICSIFIPLVLAVYFSGCSFLPLNTNANTGPVITPPKATRASEHLQLADDLFVGIAMSGGGSRAANFSAAALLELQELGILEKATILSSVSGSSLTAAYYGLYSEDKAKWDRSVIREKMRENFELNWVGRWFLPWNILRYWSSDFDRSDIMKDVFDDLLFEGKTFGNMPTARQDKSMVRPNILINATSLTTRSNFRFSDEAFHKLASRLDTYPVSHAVMASGAFPGAFHNVTLEDYSKKQTYLHLFDGGPADNLGVETLLEVYRKNPANSCLFIIVDAYPEPWGEHKHERDTRRAIDFILDTNVMGATDVLLSLRWDDVLAELEFKSGPDTSSGKNFGENVYVEFSPYSKGKNPAGSGVKCHAWLLTFQRLAHFHKILSHAKGIHKIVDNVPTRYQLLGPHGMDSKEVQDALFEAARILVQEDTETRKEICGDFGGKIPKMKCHQ